MPAITLPKRCHDYQRRLIAAYQKQPYQSVRLIAERLGVEDRDAQNDVQRLIQAGAMERRSSQVVWDADRVAWLLKQAEAGRSQQAVADEIGSSRGRVSKIALENGITFCAKGSPNRQQRINPHQPHAQTKTAPALTGAVLSKPSREENPDAQLHRTRGERKPHDTAIGSRDAADQ
jgi:DNA-binding MarR family transcriptional regulator